MSEDRVRYGVREYLETDETMRPQELVYGYVRDAASPTPPHQSAVLRFTIALISHVEERSLGHVVIAPMDCVLDTAGALVVQPDVVFVSPERAHIIRDRIWGAPDLVLEVLSPNPRIGAVDERLGWFATYGVRECWLYHQFARQLEVIQFENRAQADRRRFDFQDRIVSGVLPDFDHTCASILTIYKRSRR